MNPEVVRFLNHMAAFSCEDNRRDVATLIDKLANSPTLGSVINVKRRLPTEPDDSNAIYRIAGMALDAVEYAEGGDKPEWIGELGL